MKGKSISGEGCVKALPPAGEVAYIRGWLSSSRADELLSVLTGQVKWQSRAIRMFGKDMLQPRKIAFQGDSGIRYAYSGGLYQADAWHPATADLRDALVSETGCGFNCALLNLYRDGRDSMGWHADDEPELGPDPTIASVSLGASRRFVLRSKDDRRAKWEVVPEHGSLIVMRGDLQHHWQHQVPRTARPVGPRINLTFRKVVRRHRQPGNRFP